MADKDPENPPPYGETTEAHGANAASAVAEQFQRLFSNQPINPDNFLKVPQFKPRMHHPDSDTESDATSIDTGTIRSTGTRYEMNGSIYRYE